MISYTTFPSANHLSLLWAGSIQSMPPHPTSLRSILILSSHLDGFGGLVVSMLSAGTRVRRFKPGRSRWIFRASEGKWKNLSHVPALRHIKEPSTSVNYECASKIPCIVPSFTSRGLSCLCGAWRLWRWMRGTHWGQGYNRPTGCSGEKAPHVTF